MLNNTNQDKKIITIGILAIFFGIVLLSANYFQAKKDKAFETINFDLFDQQLENDSTEIVSSEEINNSSSTENTTNNKNYASYYIGYIEIPKINLKKGFVDKKSKQNNVEQNVTIVNPSSYPDVDRGNFILAAHSGNGYIGYFQDLYRLSKGDTINIQYKEVKYVYKIVKIYEQPKNGSIRIYRNNRKTTLTLVTCTNHDDKTQTVYIAEQTT